jgi:hypothetical protein
MYGIYIEGEGAPLHAEDECAQFRNATQEQKKQLWDIYRIEFKPVDVSSER